MANICYYIRSFTCGNILLRKYLFNIGCSFYDVTIPFIFIQGVCYILFSIYLCLHEKRALLPKQKIKI